MRTTVQQSLYPADTKSPSGHEWAHYHRANWHSSFGTGIVAGGADDTRKNRTRYAAAGLIFRFFQAGFVGPREARFRQLAERFLLSQRSEG
jgi:hypothetical protein